MNKTTRTAAAPNDAVSFAPLFGSGDIELRTTQKAVTPFGGIVSFLAWLKQLGFLAAVQGAMPFEYKSPNCIGPAAILSAFLLSVILGARRFAHTGWLRFDRAFHALLGLTRYPGEDAVRGFFHRFTMASIQTFWRPLWIWLLGHLGPAIAVAGYSLDLDSTILQRSGKQEGAAKGYNPGRPGRFSHHPLLAVLAEAPFVLHAWLRSGNTAAGRGVVAFLQEALALLPAGWRLRMLRADSGFFDHQLLSFCEERELPYLVVARLTAQVKAGARSLTEWTKIDERFCVGEFRCKLQGWHIERRFIVLRERVEEKPSEREAKGRKLIDVPGFTFRIWVTNAAGAPMVLWRDYNQRATVEQRIEELKNDLSVGGFCTQAFYATEAAFLASIFAFNLLAVYQLQVLKGSGYRQPATLRAAVFVAGAILGQSGRTKVVRLAACWGGLDKHRAFLEQALRTQEPNSPILDPDLVI